MSEWECATAKAIIKALLVISFMNMLKKKNFTLNMCISHLCHVEPQADGLALLEKSVELSAVKQIIQVTPQSFQNILRKLHFLIVPACQSMSAPIQQYLQRKRVKIDMNKGLVDM